MKKIVLMLTFVLLVSMAFAACNNNSVAKVEAYDSGEQNVQRADDSDNLTGGTITLEHNGMYVAWMDVSWTTTDGESSSLSTGRVTPHTTQSYELPDNAENISIQVHGDSGLIWEKETGRLAVEAYQLENHSYNVEIWGNTLNPRGQVYDSTADKVIE